jgi:hypothetical protein
MIEKNNYLSRFWKLFCIVESNKNLHIYDKTEYKDSNKLMILIVMNMLSSIKLYLSLILWYMGAYLFYGL